MNYRRKRPKDKVGGSEWSHPYIEKGTHTRGNVSAKREAISANRNFYDWEVEEYIVEYHR